ncbi:hypothetical protein M407DRAFT_80244 [Tulasnella calospora MUT 4182]|uniref:Uncharacterized protein n=1 Tax=Tulasnella calospora MUT 4182 TaxID=1051891 RepID=A0A0C3LJK0_9AGAM|nr:hypothetical protein M407DRAFT_80244 [Tulasnella calospora MUT 4182]
MKSKFLAQLLLLIKAAHTLFSIFYQRCSNRLTACVITVHAWLHIVDMMEQSGPLWAYWCWVMERFCGRLTRAISSRKHPYASLNRRIHEIQTLHAIRHIYGLEEELPPYTAMYNSNPLPTYGDLERYPEITLLHPRRVLSLEDDDLKDLRRRIAVFLRTQYNVSLQDAKGALPTSITQFGKLQIREADTVYSSNGYGQRQENQRDASFIQYELLIDERAHRRNEEPVLSPRTFFGQLERVFICVLHPSAALEITEPTPLILMDVNCCNTAEDRFGFHEYTHFRGREIVDGTAIRALVGRIMDRDKWVFVRRKGVYEHASYTEII